jgi:hypothetical protein
MKIIIWTHGFDTHTKLDNDNIIYTLEEENSLLWSDANEERKYREEMFNSNSDEIIEYMKKHIKINSDPNEMIFSFFRSFKTLNAGENMKHFIVYQTEDGYFMPLNTPDVITLSEIINKGKELTNEKLEIYCYTCRQDYNDFVNDLKSSGKDISKLRVSDNCIRKWLKK